MAIHWYRHHARNHPFALFGLPFLLSVVAASFFLTPIVDAKYERNDKRTQSLESESELQRSKHRRRVNVNDEYYRMMNMGQEDYDIVRVERLPGEPVWDKDEQQ
ncbi:inner membrane protein [Schizosaccharomyces japonicus yFS275]|uniref:Cytochrome c oxidase assembly protein COX16, mitochondrial n=1 Tax=Schizosaccharomyces japonicus (strain yFS275 / FY16936) TaxID=402676 RepID=B6K3V4_SCHJY|nr:inner membrane protein [Schizosaccharomyces japonicus yFS275]EEB08161.1 inner membrane protein [Schizosaccharomyces japonicus yFS275]